MLFSICFFFSSRRRHTRSLCDWSSDVCSSDLDLTDVVSLKFRYGRFTLQRVHVQPVIDLTDDGANRFRCVAQRITLIQMQLLFTYPTERRFEFRSDLRWLWLAGNHISAPNVEIVGQRQGNGLTGECLLKKTILRHDSCDRGSR